MKTFNKQNRTPGLRPALLVVLAGLLAGGVGCTRKATLQQQQQRTQQHSTTHEHHHSLRQRLRPARYLGFALPEHWPTHSDSWLLDSATGVGLRLVPRVVQRQGAGSAAGRDSSGGGRGDTLVRRVRDTLWRVQLRLPELWQTETRYQRTQQAVVQSAARWQQRRERPASAGSGFSWRLFLWGMLVGGLGWALLRGVLRQLL